jgi:spore maturation protein CgeD
MVAASVFLPSYNKPTYVLDAINSILGQTCADWELWLVENSTDQQTRGVIAASGVLSDPRIRYTEVDVPNDTRESVYVPAWLINQYYPQANGEYMFYLSDDDILGPDCIQACVTYLDTYADKSVCYFSMDFVRVGCIPASANGQVTTIKADVVRGPRMVDCHIDGGQVAHRKSCLDKLKQPYFPETLDTETRHADGVFLESLAEHYDFWPIPHFLATHRYTPASLWSK